MRGAVEFSLQGKVIRKVIVAVSRRRPVRPDLARILPQQAPGLDAHVPRVIRLLTYRSEFEQITRASGIDGLIKRLREENA
jgi:hypothetical protein